MSLELHETEFAWQQPLASGARFPAALVAAPNATVTPATGAAWFGANRDAIEAACARSGALLVRGAGLRSAEDFDAALRASGYDFQMTAHVGGGGPRLPVLGEGSPVHTSTESPAEFYIPFHHELAYINNPPSKLFFFCSQPSADPPEKKGGETPVLHSPTVYAKIAHARPQFVADIEAKGVTYTRRLLDRANSKDKYQKAWQDVLQAETRDEAEAAAKASGHDKVEWLENGDCRVTSRIFAGIRSDERAPESPTWFNAIVLLHPAAHEADVSDFWAVRYGDGSEIPDEDIVAAKKIMDESGTCFKYEQGDVLIVDNYMALHARNPFTPPRLILAAMVK